MMKYFVALCLCLTMGIVLAQDQETTTEKRVARDINVPEVPNFSGIPDAMSDMANKFADGARNVLNGMKDMIPNGDSVGMATARRRRSPQENGKPPRPPKMD